jgi:NitT/TauT family transport system permease protein
MDNPGLASTILTSQQHLDTPMMFAALALVSLTGVIVYFGMHLLSRWLLGGWHASALGED